mmetsp:Transcript_12048/g.22545  ORF Transcript_12048/g.22545 Transcript_12048/m.22545 type:complete len:243 (-) Transcript_12048:132-860(-)
MSISTTTTTTSTTPILPKNKISWILLLATILLIHSPTKPRFHSSRSKFPIPVRPTTIHDTHQFFKLVHIKINPIIQYSISHPIVHDPLYIRYDGTFHMIRHSCHNGRSHNIECIHIDPKFLFITFSQFQWWYIAFFCPCQYLIIDIGYIHDEDRHRSQRRQRGGGCGCSSTGLARQTLQFMHMKQTSLKNVQRNICPCMSQMCRVIHCGTTGIPCYAFGGVGIVTVVLWYYSNWNSFTCLTK